MKSKAMCDQGQDGIGRGRSSPAGGELLDLDWAQTGQEATKLRTSRTKASHQNPAWRRDSSREPQDERTWGQTVYL